MENIFQAEWHILIFTVKVCAEPGNIETIEGENVNKPKNTQKEKPLFDIDAAQNKTLENARKEKITFRMYILICGKVREVTEIKFH